MARKFIGPLPSSLFLVGLTANFHIITQLNTFLSKRFRDSRLLAFTFSGIPVSAVITVNYRELSDLKVAFFS